MNKDEKVNGKPPAPEDSLSKLKESQNKLQSELQAIRTKRNVED